MPAQGHTVEENQRALEDLLQRFKSNRSTRSRWRAPRRRDAPTFPPDGSNRDLAGLLALQSASYGDWRKLFTSLDDLNKVKAEDVQRAAKRYLWPPAAPRYIPYCPASPMPRRRPSRQSARPEVRNESRARYSPSGGCRSAQAGGIPVSGAPRADSRAAARRTRRHPGSGAAAPPRRARPRAAPPRRRRRCPRPRISSIRRCAPSSSPVPPRSHCPTA